MPPAGGPAQDLLRHDDASRRSTAGEHPGGLGVRCSGVVHLYRTFEGHDVVALSGVDLVIRPGERVAFLGPSGSGKSTLLTLLGGIQKPSAGRIFLGEHEISRMPEPELAALRSRRVSTMLQGATRNLLPYATARQNVGFARLALTRAERKEAVPERELLARVGLEEVADQVVTTLSGGQRQRLALACAVACGPQLLLADEPTSQLSHADRDAVVALLHDLGDELGTTVVVVTHAPEVADTFPRTVTMKGGRVGSEGHAGAEYVVVGAEGVVHLPTHLAEEWPAGTLVRIEPEDVDRLVVSRGAGDQDQGPDRGRGPDAGGAGGGISETLQNDRRHP
ncbi:ABC transporter ATP-binding protein [Nocardioides bruguierae]|uniref:ABC transporter ATP-binding protein n=1 Tax=Nocardioides bruguierae TaxID=2945102 RepID=UPI0020204744|nr:ATP-binding cassette domain-containing protein [Nocardioides bruguierae]MCL8026656.1 ATP-binding cassette domain-containing protein [Nocardioides bruguierae]